MSKRTTALEVSDAMANVQRNKPLDNESMKVYMKLVMIEQQNGNTFFEDLDLESDRGKAMNGAMPVTIYCKRAMHHKLPIRISIEAALALSLFDGRPGAMVMNLAFIAGYVKRRNPEMIDVTLKYVSQELFPLGYFADDMALLEIWESQKKKREQSGTDNWLDYDSAWESVR